LSKELEFAKAERERLQGELSALAKKREKLSDTSQLAAAERMRDEFEAAEADTVSKWAHAGCIGARPIPDTAKHAELTAAVTAARRAIETIGPALEAIAASEQELQDRLGANRVAIAIAAAHKMAEDYTAIGKRADALRAELRKFEVQLEAGHFYWKNHADSHYQSHGKRQPAFDAPHLAVSAAHPLEIGHQYPLPERAAIKAHADKFEELQK
jgi:cysteinyl-tRNA synthetase